MTHEEMIKKINYYDKDDYINDKKKINKGITGWLNEIQRGKDIKRSTKEERIEYYEKLLKIAEERKKEVLQQENESKNSKFAMIIAGNLRFDKINIDEEIREIQRKINKEKGIVTEEDLEIEALMEEFENFLKNSDFNENNIAYTKNNNKEEKKEEKREIKNEEFKIDPWKMLQKNIIHKNGKRYVNEIEIKEIYSKKYGIFIDIDNQYRTFQGVKISNINAYLYKCEE